MPADIKDILYSVIDNIGKEKIRMAVISKIERSEGHCNEILDKCKSKMGHEIDDETLVTLCEALLHFMLTASMLPSERKVIWKGAQLDIVVPSLRMLDKQPKKTLIVQIIKKYSDFTKKIEQAKSVQPCYGNIWIVSAKELKIDRKNYYISSGDFPLCRIISDINAFLVANREWGLKLLHG